MAAGRPTLWEDSFSAAGFAQALLGKTNPEIAEALGVSISTFKVWLRDKPVFRAAIARGKAEADGRVVASLYELCSGFTREVELTKILANGTIVTTTTKRYFPPDVRAIEIWLRNRVRHLWTVGDNKVSDQPQEDPADWARATRDALREMQEKSGLVAPIATE